MADDAHDEDVDETVEEGQTGPESEPGPDDADQTDVHGDEEPAETEDAPS